MSQLPHLKSLIYRFVILLLAYSTFRLVFFWMNIGLFPEVGFKNGLVILIQGIRFDITAILYLNFLPFLLSILPIPIWNNRMFRNLVASLFVLFNALGFILILTDLAFYPFNAKRLDSEFLGFLGAIPALLSSFISNYWPLFIGLAILLYGLILLARKTSFHSNGIAFSYSKNAIAFVLLAGLMILGLRGGVQSRPIRPVLSAAYVPLELTPLITNSPFTFVYSLLNRRLEKKNYYSEEEVEKRFPVKRIMQCKSPDKQRPNIVYIIMESFGGVYAGHLGHDTTYMPYLDTLSSESFFFTRSFSNGRRSSQGLVALTAGIPALMDDPYMYSPYLNNKVSGLPLLLKNYGYETSFFNGSDKVMLGWEEFISSAGFDRYYSRDNYPYEGHYDGNWGIYDHLYLKYFSKQLDGFQEPFFSTFFSISSHDPFIIPEELQPFFSQGPKEYHNALRYADWSLALFFKKARKQPWFDNTIFIITADHTINAGDNSPDADYNLNAYRTNRIGLYYTPTLIYAPKLIAPGKSDKVIQQTDLFNTALELACYEGPYYSFGNSVFDEKEGCAFQYVKGIYQLIEDDFIFLMKEDEPYALYNYKTDRLLTENILSTEEHRAKRMMQKLKAIIQQHNNHLVQNDLAIPGI